MDPKGLIIAVRRLADFGNLGTVEWRKPDDLWIVLRLKAFAKGMGRPCLFAHRTEVNDLGKKWEQAWDAWALVTITAKLPLTIRSMSSNFH